MSVIINTCKIAALHHRIPSLRRHILLQPEHTTHTFTQGQKQQLTGTGQVKLNHGDDLTWRKLTTLSEALGFQTNQRA